MVGTHGNFTRKLNTHLGLLLNNISVVDDDDAMHRTVPKALLYKIMYTYTRSYIYIELYTIRINTYTRCSIIIVALSPILLLFSRFRPIYYTNTYAHSYINTQTYARIVMCVPYAHAPVTR